MSEMFDNYPQPDDYIPNNRPKPIEREELKIVTGETVTHTFHVPFNVEEQCYELEVIYKLGVKPIIIKNSYSLEITIEEDNTTTIKCTLTPEETKLFANTLLSARVQTKYYLNNGDVTFSKIDIIDVTDSLELGREEPKNPNMVYGTNYGYTED